MMRKILLASLMSAFALGALAQAPAKSGGKALCDSCGTVQAVKQEKRKGEGGAAGIVGGAVVGGLLGNQVGGGSGKTLATAGGAVAGGMVGNEVQKRVTAKTVWVTTVRMKDGRVRNFEQEAQPGWAAGNVVQVQGGALVRR